MVLVAVGWAWLTGKLGLYAMWGFVPMWLGLLLISYAVFQIHEALLAFFGEFSSSFMPGTG